MRKAKYLLIVSVLAILVLLLTGCDNDPNLKDTSNTTKVSKTMAANLPTPTDITYSLSRYNLIRRAYYFAGQEEKAKNLECAINKPTKYIYFFIEGAGWVGSDTVDGVITPLRSYLTPDTDRPNHDYADWLADVDGTYGENPDGIFYFDKDGHYHEWTGKYHFTDIYYPNGVPTIQRCEKEY